MEIDIFPDEHDSSADDSEPDPRESGIERLNRKIMELVSAESRATGVPTDSLIRQTTLFKMGSGEEEEEEAATEEEDGSRINAILWKIKTNHKKQVWDRLVKYIEEDTILDPNKPGCKLAKCTGRANVVLKPAFRGKIQQFRRYITPEMLGFPPGTKNALRTVSRAVIIALDKCTALPPEGHQCSHLCHDNQCVEASHVIFESATKNQSKRNVCRTNKICSCGLNPPCFPGLSPDTPQKKGIQRKLDWKK